MLEAARAFFSALGVWSVFWLSAVGPYAFPAAGELAVLGSAAGGSESLAVIAVLAFAGAVVSDHIAYWAGRLLGEKVVRRLPPPRRARFETWVSHHAPAALVAGRMVTGVRTNLCAIAGAGRLGYGRFMVLNTFGCALWAVAFTLLGRALAARVDVTLLVDRVGRAGLGLFLAVVAVVAVRGLLVRRRRRRPAPAV